MEAVDAAEAANRFKPPTFVDIRLRRSGRAKGFVGDAFAEVVGDSRYQWMKKLGNRAIATGTEGVDLVDPSAVSELLDLSIDLAKEKRRVLYYCACEFPRIDGKQNCHRDVVTRLLIKEARKRGSVVQAIEWPGNEPAVVSVDVDLATFNKLERGRKSIPLGETIDLPKFGGLPWGSIADVHCAPSKSLKLIVGPAKYSKGWFLPVLIPYDAEDTMGALRRYATDVRHELGLTAYEV